MRGIRPSQWDIAPYDVKWYQNFTAAFGVELRSDFGETWLASETARTRISLTMQAQMV